MKYNAKETRQLITSAVPMAHNRTINGTILYGVITEQELMNRLKTKLGKLRTQMLRKHPCVFFEFYPDWDGPFTNIVIADSLGAANEYRKKRAAQAREEELGLEERRRQAKTGGKRKR